MDRRIGQKIVRILALFSDINVHGVHAHMTILVAVKKNGRVFLGADRLTAFGDQYRTDLVNGSKIIKLKHAYLASSGYGLVYDVIKHLRNARHKMMNNTFSDTVQVFSFFLELYNELKKSYTLVDSGKETYASIYNSFLAVTPKNIYGIATDLSICEYESFVAQGCGYQYAEGCLHGIYDLMDDGFEITRLALEAACRFSVYCKEPLEITDVTGADFQNSKRGYKKHRLVTIQSPKGVGDLIAVTKSDVKPSAQRRRKRAEVNGQIS